MSKATVLKVSKFVLVMIVGGILTGLSRQFLPQGIIAMPHSYLDVPWAIGVIEGIIVVKIGML